MVLQFVLHFGMVTVHGVAQPTATSQRIAELNCGSNLPNTKFGPLNYAYNNGQIQVAEAERLTKRTWGTSKKDLTKLVDKSLLRFIAATKTP